MYDIKELVNSLKEKYNTYLLSREQTAETCGISISTLDRLRTNALGPKYKKIGKSKNATIKYSITDVAQYILNQNIETF